MMQNLLVAVATNKSEGNSLAAVVAADVGDATAFDNAGIPLYPMGTVFAKAPDLRGHTATNEPVAWAVVSQCSNTVCGLVQEYNTEGPYPALNAVGVQDAQVTWFKSRVKVQAGDLSFAWRDYIESLGYAVP